jgi:hypothetical protein
VRRAHRPHALFLARGDKRPYAIVHHTGEVLSLPSYSGLRTREIRARLGEPDGWSSVEQIRQQIRDREPEGVKRRMAEARARQAQQGVQLREKLKA